MCLCHLPPTEDPIKQHVQRATFQAAMRRHSHIPEPLLWSPVGNGWTVRDGSLQPILFTKPPGPTEVRDITHLCCKDANRGGSGKRQCLSVVLPCAEHQNVLKSV